MAVYLEVSNIICSLGSSVEEVYQNIFDGKTGVQIGEYPHLWNEIFPAGLVNSSELNEIANKFGLQEDLSRFDKLMLCSSLLCQENTKIDFSSERTVFLLSTTKGNVDQLENEEQTNEVFLWDSAQRMASYFNNPNKPIVVSNACVSGSMAMLVAKRMIDAGQYDHAVVVGADVLSKFIVSGFQSFKSLSSQVCRPFDKDRDGLSLGEGAGTVVLTKENANSTNIELVNGATSNDANHISGPSRTGEGLLLAIKNTLSKGEKVDCISAHGTATPYNDDMESKAIFRAELQNVPVNSLKAYIGHTLGAAGIIESLISVKALQNNVLLKSLGLNNLGVAEEINLIKETKETELNTLLKLVSGFGGCNTAILFKKHA